MTTAERILELLPRNLQEVFGEGDAASRRAAIEDLYTDDCVLYVPDGASLGTPHWTNSPGNYVRPSAICLYAPWSAPSPAQRRNPCLGLGVERGAARVHRLRRCSGSRRARSPRCTSFSIRNCPLPSTTSRPLATSPSCAVICRSRQNARHEAEHWRVWLAHTDKLCGSDRNASVTDDGGLLVLGDRLGQPLLVADLLQRGEGLVETGAEPRPGVKVAGRCCMPLMTPIVS